MFDQFLNLILALDHPGILTSWSSVSTNWTCSQLGAGTCAQAPAPSWMAFMGGWLKKAVTYVGVWMTGRANWGTESKENASRNTMQSKSKRDANDKVCLRAARGRYDRAPDRPCVVQDVRSLSQPGLACSRGHPADVRLPSVLADDPLFRACDACAAAHACIPCHPLHVLVCQIIEGNLRTALTHPCSHVRSEFLLGLRAKR